MLRLGVKVLVTYTLPFVYPTPLVQTLDFSYCCVSPILASYSNRETVFHSYQITFVGRIRRVLKAKQG